MYVTDDLAMEGRGDRREMQLVDGQGCISHLTCKLDTSNLQAEFQPKITYIPSSKSNDI